MKLNSVAFVIASILAVGLLVFFFWGKLRDQKTNEFDGDIQNSLIALTERMKLSSESSDAGFDLWADLNELILEKATEFYNGSQDSLEIRYERTRKFVSYASGRLSDIENADRHQESLSIFIQELKRQEIGSDFQPGETQ